MTALAAICFASEVEVRLLEHTAYRQEYHSVRIANTNAIIPVSPGGAKKIPSLCSEQAVRSNKVNVIARSVATRQSHTRNCHCEERSDAAISTFFHEIATLPSVARNDIVKIHIAFILNIAAPS